jgi:hypothetical protein
LQKVNQMFFIQDVRQICHGINAGAFIDTDFFNCGSCGTGAARERSALMGPASPALI